MEGTDSAQQKVSQAKTRLANYTSSDVVKLVSGAQGKNWSVLRAALKNNGVHGSALIPHLDTPLAMHKFVTQQLGCPELPVSWSVVCLLACTPRISS